MFVITFRHFTREGKASSNKRFPPTALLTVALDRLNQRYRHYERLGYPVRWNASQTAFVVENKGKFYASYAVERLQNENDA